MKTKIVVKVSMNDDKSRTKALQISVGISGVESAALTGQERDRVEVVGDDVDAVELTRQLRKNVAYAELVSVAEAKKEAPATAAVVAPTPQPAVVWTSYAAPCSGDGAVGGGEGDIKLGKLDAKLGKLPRANFCFLFWKDCNQVGKRVAEFGDLDLHGAVGRLYIF
ncbi:hypothetical protein ABFS83_13G050300 [Erythranthe nasuta]